MSSKDRREFLKSAAAITAAAVTTGIVASEAHAQNAGGYASKNFKAEDTIKKGEWRSSGADGTGIPLTELKRPLNILVFGAHPDDAELKAGGVAAKWAAKGHKVKLVSVTNGDMGYWKNTGIPLAARRKREQARASEILGTKCEVLDIGDGTLEPTLENRLKLIRLIREWKADIVMGHRPTDYQADHRYTGVLMQDTAFLCAVPGILPEIPVVPNPVYLYLYDYFQRPYPFNPDIAVSIDSVVEKKTNAVDVMDSQFYEGGCMSSDATLPKTPEDAKKRRAEIRRLLAGRNEQCADRFRAALIKWYGKEKGEKIKNAEAFEICEYGRKVTEAEIRFLFPFD
ncbi:MAG: PIG-L family deacetylase [Thermoguttaceae bacterium]|nr:PIG-L family deacetylase [Thermoguttaceae bacterium]